MENGCRLAEKFKTTMKKKGWAYKFSEFYTLLKLPKPTRKLIWKVVRKKYTYLSIRRLAALAKAAEQVSQNLPKGIFIEAGCALGGSTAVIAHHKPQNSRFNVYDVFGQIPPPSNNDPETVQKRYTIIATGKAQGIQGDPYYGYQPDLYQKVIQNLQELQIDPQKHHVQLIKGLLQDTLRLHNNVAFAHIDVDWHDPVLCCLERIFPKLMSGGVLIVDDYFDWGGCRQATDRFLETVPGQYRIIIVGGALQIWKN